MTLLLRRARWTALLATLPALASAQSEHRALSGDRVSIYNLVGELKVRPTAGSQVTVDVTRGGHDAGKLKLETGDVRGWQALRVIYPSDQIVYPNLARRSRSTLRVNADGTFNDDDHDGDSRRGAGRVEIRDSGSGLEAHADLVVNVPKGQRVAIHWGVGVTDIANVDGDLRVSVASARVTSNHTSGRLTLDTGSGEVDVADAQGDVRLDTGSGGLTLRNVHGENLDVDAGSGNVQASDIDVRSLKIDVGSGGLRIDRVKASRVTVDAGSGSTELGFLSTIDDLTVDAGSGGITLRLPANQGGAIDVTTGSGGIQSDFAVQTTRIARNHLAGRIGQGDGRIRIESGSGAVRLLKN
jgi:lia operon protein LiaG